MELIFDSTRKQRLNDELRSRLKTGVDLPVLPDVAHELILLRNRPSADVADVVRIITKDPVISAQFMRYGRMAIYGYGERIESIDEVIQLVLGYEKALYMAMGLSAGKSLRIEMDGPLGAKATWQNSLKNALVSQFLAKELPSENRPNEGLSYLAGLLHEIGFLVLGVLYPQEFAALNRTVGTYNQMEARELEFHCLGISHDMIGSQLLHNWSLPEEVVTAVAEHHFPEYDGKHAIYAKLVYLANRLIHMSDGVTYSDKDLLMFAELGLDEAAIERVLANLNEMASDLDVMVEKLVA